jgi:hypothetical protein
LRASGSVPAPSAETFGLAALRFTVSGRGGLMYYV